MEFPKLSRPTDDGRRECLLCPIRCKLRKNQAGACIVRSGTDNGVELNAYGKLTHIAIEPIEKKPIWHYRPGIKTLSAGSFGCNQRCDFCQNWMVSQSDCSSSAQAKMPEEIISIAKQKSCQAICFTYNEPTIYYEYVLDVANLCAKNSLDLILKTNAYCEEEPWKYLCSFVQAMNIDWKGTVERYRSVAKADGSNILDRIEDAVEKGIHVEISVPVYQDSRLEEYTVFRDFIRAIGNGNIPIHLLKIFPAYKSTIVPVTSDALLFRLRDFLSERNNYVYIANVFSDKNVTDTYCKQCKTKVVSRSSLSAQLLIDSPCCSDCPINVDVSYDDTKKTTEKEYIPVSAG